MLVIAIAVSVLYRHSHPPQFLGDTYGILRAAQYIRVKRSYPAVLEYNLQDSLEAAEFDAPPLLMLLLAMLPPSYVEKRIRIFSLLNDLGCMLTLGIGAWLLSNDPFVALLTMALYSCTPNTAASSLMLTSRFLSVALLTISLCLLFHYLGGAGTWALIAAAGTGAVLLISNALAIQAWALILVALVCLSPQRGTYLLYAGASIAVCYAAADGIAWRVHRGLITKLAILKKYSLDDIAIGRHELLDKIRGRSSQHASLRWRGLRILLRSSLFVDYPFVWLLALGAARGTFVGVSGDLTLWLGVLLACNVVVDSVPALRFVGPAHRYLSYGFVPAGLLVSRVLEGPKTRAAATSLLVLLLVIGMIETGRRFRLMRRAYDIDLDQLRDIAAKLAVLEVDRVFVLPAFLSDALGYLSGKKMLQGWSSRAWSVGPRYRIHPVLELPMQEVIRLFALEAIVVKKNYVFFAELGIRGASKIGENDGYEIYHVSS